MKRVAIYARYSSDLQSPTSIEDQVALCTRFAERRGWTVVGTFEDRAVSGASSANRDRYQALLREAFGSQPAFDAIIVEDLSRLTRDTAELLKIVKKLKFTGIEIVGASDGIASNQKGAKLALTVRGMMNEAYLDDLGERTHRGLMGSVTRHLSAGGRTFGYRSVLVREEGSKNQSAAARTEIEPTEAAIVLRIFSEYGSGTVSLKGIARKLNADGIAYPAKDTKKGPIRKGWAPASVRFILRNEKYIGAWTWNQRQFMKDPDTGKRRSVPRPREEWVVQHRPELRIVPEELWQRVQERIRLIEQRYVQGSGGFSRNARMLYSPHLLSGILRCGSCGARMQVVTTTRSKRDKTYRQSWLRCAFAFNKGTAVCRHDVSYRKDLVEEAIAQRFGAAMSEQHVDRLTALVNDAIARTLEGARSVKTVSAEIRKLQEEAENLVRFLMQGGDSALVRDKLAKVESRLACLAAEKAQAEAVVVRPPSVVRGVILAKLERLEELLRKDPVAARVEILRHLDGDLTLTPLPSPVGERRAEIAGRVTTAGLLAQGTSSRLQVVAGGGFEPPTFGL